MTERIVTPKPIAEESNFEAALRPKIIADFVGQSRVKEKLRIFIEAAKSRGEALDHCFLFGPPGLGKTTLANIISNELGVGIRSTSGPVIQRPGDLAAILTNLKEKRSSFHRRDSQADSPGGGNPVPSDGRL